MKIACLAENTAVDERFGSEHGLSLFIETGEHRILFDMGQTGLFAENAEKMGIDLACVDLAVLSHGHYDHGGGLKTFFELNRTAPVYLSRYAFEPHYNGAGKYIGLDPSLPGGESRGSGREQPGADGRNGTGTGVEAGTEMGDETATGAATRFRFTEEKAEIGKGLTLFSCNDRERKHGFGNFGLTVMEEGELVPDDFRHEQYLLIEEAGKRILISGCSHKGILDLTDWFRPDVLVGGFHFMKIQSGEELAGYAEYLNGFATEYYTGHYTGAEQYAFMEKRMDRLHGLSAGQAVEI